MRALAVACARRAGRTAPARPTRTATQAPRSPGVVAVYRGSEANVASPVPVYRGSAAARLPAAAAARAGRETRSAGGRSGSSTAAGDELTNCRTSDDLDNRATASVCTRAPPAATSGSPPRAQREGQRQPRLLRASDTCRPASSTRSSNIRHGTRSCSCSQLQAQAGGDHARHHLAERVHPAVGARVGRAGRSGRHSRSGHRRHTASRSKYGANQPGIGPCFGAASSNTSADGWPSAR